MVEKFEISDLPGILGRGTLLVGLTLIVFPVVTCAQRRRRVRSMISSRSILLHRRWFQGSMSVEIAMSFWESSVASRSTNAARIEVYVPLPRASRLGAGLRSTESIIA
jgi:hypothetical protein